MKLLLIDTCALFHRSRSALFRAMGEMMTSYGIPVTGTYGFCNALFATMDTHKYDCVIPCYDRGGNFRKKESGSYKANREKSSIAHYADQSLLLEEVLPTLGFNPVGVEGYEADDIIAHIARKSYNSFSEIHILTCDKDLLQLVNDKVKVILFNSAKKVELVDEEGVVKHFKVPPSQVKFYKALCGDSSDNIAGIKGIGPKTAVSIIEDSDKEDKDSWLSLSDRIALHQKVRENAATFLANLRLVDLSGEVPDLTWYASGAPNEDQVRALFHSLEFKSYLKDKRMGKILDTLQVSNCEKSGCSSADP